MTTADDDATTTIAADEDAAAADTTSAAADPAAPSTAADKPGRRRPLTLRGVSYGSISAALTVHASSITDPVLRRKPWQRQIQTISERLISGWSPEQAFGFAPPPARAAKAQPRPIVCDGRRFDTLKSFAAHYGISKKLACQRLDREKWAPEAVAGLIPPPLSARRMSGAKGAIYLIQHRDLGLGYVGLSTSTPRRYKRHLAQAASGTAVPGTIQHAIAEYGIDKFTFDILEADVPADLMGHRERHWIRQLGTLKPHGYNQNGGGVIGGYSVPVAVGGALYQGGLAAVAQHFGMTRSKLSSRLNNGWTLEEAAGLVERKRRGRQPLDVHVGQPDGSRFPSLAAACRRLDLDTRRVLQHATRTGLELAEAVRDLFFQTHRLPVQDEQTCPVPRGWLPNGRRRRPGYPRPYVVQTRTGDQLRLNLPFQRTGFPAHRLPLKLVHNTD